MQKPLDPLRFKQNRYDRPNQDWVCGHAAEGRACPLGPDAKGNCRHTGQCLPARKGDRWLCMRTEAGGGNCAEGPLPNGACAHPIPPCQPVPSIRRARGRLVWQVVALTFGALLILLGSGLRPRWTDPGALTNAHATSAAKCSDCHAADANGHPPMAALADLDRQRRADSALCLKCHSLGSHPLEPHGVTAASLIALQKKAINRPNESAWKPLLLQVSHAVNPIRAGEGLLACMTCHQEHHGRQFDLKQLSDAQCQRCHAVQFASFAQGHPDFGSYPYRARTRIFFDHASHLRQYFRERKDKAPDSCDDCHAKGPSGRFMEVKNFAQTCAGCHAGQIQGEGMTVKGVAFFSVPGIDADTLAAKGISIGEWPKFADAKLTPFMELLLDRQPGMRAIRAKLGRIDLLDLTSATPEQLAAAGKFAWGVKTLLFHLAVEGQSFLMKEMGGEVATVGLEVPRAALLSAQREWVPNLFAEVDHHLKGIEPPLPKTAEPKPTPAPSPNKKAPEGDESLLGDDLAAEPTPAAEMGDGDLLAGGSDDLVAASPSPAADDDLTSGDLLSGAASPTAEATATSSPVVAIEPMKAEEWVAAGGWYRPQDAFTLFYRPSGHADPFLVAWLVAAARLDGKPDAPVAHAALQKLADPQNPGLCMKCHTMTRNGGATLLRWEPVASEIKAKTFTTFSHAAHLSLVGDAGCQTCHELNPKAEYAKFFSGPAAAEASRNPTFFASNFAPLSKTLCVQCHQKRVAGDACLLCHRYHSGSPAETLRTAGLLKPARK